MQVQSGVCTRRYPLRLHRDKEYGKNCLSARQTRTSRRKPTFNVYLLEVPYFPTMGVTSQVLTNGCLVVNKAWSAACTAAQSIVRSYQDPEQCCLHQIPQSCAQDEHPAPREQGDRKRARAAHPSSQRIVPFCVSLSVSLYLCVSVGMRMDLTLVHSCTFVSLVTELLCALDHCSIAFALAQVAPEKSADKRQRKRSLGTPLPQRKEKMHFKNIEQCSVRQKITYIMYFYVELICMSHDIILALG